jgi:hypothetical protein
MVRILFLSAAFEKVWSLVAANPICHKGTDGSHNEWRRDRSSSAVAARMELACEKSYDGD